MTHLPPLAEPLVGRSEETIFERAIAQPAAQRCAFLDSACVNDRALHARLAALVRAHEHACDFMERPLAELAHAAAVTGETGSSPKPGDNIGRYILLEQIGEGGCGVVYLAAQDGDPRHCVALKIIKAGANPKETFARFETERQALARMNHPSIARVLDAGSTASGRPFLVMELVRGLRITDYCDRHNLTVERRLDVFIKVCRAIAHAHERGIVHRDIKPSNVLVTLHDGEAVPKVIDFGIATAVPGMLIRAPHRFSCEPFAGTPAYTSPEQAGMGGVDVDARSDVYSLGVLLYELLTGHTPFAAAELMQSGLSEMRRRIRDQPAPRPSRRLRMLEHADRASIARHRSTESANLVRRLRGDLDAIVMRCLEKDRTRRYRTVGALVRDVRRHLNNQRVSARRPRATHLFRYLHWLAPRGRRCGVFPAVTAGIFFASRTRRNTARVPLRSPGLPSP